MYIIDLWSDVKYSILVAIKTLFLDLCSAVYKLIVYTFDIFFTLGEAKILDDPTIQGIYTRVGLILGLFMIFRLTFAGIQYLIDPDTMLDKQKGIGNIIKKVLLVVLLLGSTQYIFKKAYELQHLIIEDNVLSRIILQESGTPESKGGELAYQIFIPFFQPNDAVINYCNKDGNCNNDSNNYEYCISQVKPQSEDTVLKFDFQQTPPDMRIAYMCLSESIDLPIDGSKKTSKEFIINFEGFVALAVAIVVLWTIMTYTIQVGVRAMQLAYLQLIAPIPIMMYLTPKGDETLKKWGQQCATTFFDFFIRAAIFYFIILVINALETATLQIDYNKSWALGYLYMKVVLIIALLTFAKKVPALLKEIFPSMGGAASFDFGIKSPKKAISDIPFVGGMASKTLGYMGNAGKKIGGFVAKNTVGRAWAATGGRAINRMKANYNANAEARKARYEYKDKLKDIDATYKKYGNDFEAGNYDKVFGDKDYITTYQNLQNAKEAAKAAYGENTYEYNEAIKPFKEAHEAQQTAKPILASREKALKSYANYHPTEKKPQWESNSATQQSANQTNASSTSNRQIIDLPTAAQIVNDSSASYDEQIRAAEELDAAAKERVKKENRLNEAAQTINNPNASAAEQERAAKILDAAARERNNKNN